MKFKTVIKDFGALSLVTNSVSSASASVPGRFDARPIGVRGVQGNTGLPKLTGSEDKALNQLGWRTVADKLI